jgi:hypothetical protein
VFAGQVLGDTAKSLQERFGKVLQERQSTSTNRQDTSTSTSTQMDYLIPTGKISNLRQGTFVGNVVEDFGIEMTQNIFHAKIMVDNETVKKEEQQYIEIPQLTLFADQYGEDRMEDIVNENFRQIKQDVREIVTSELQRIAADPNLKYLLENKQG